MSRKSRTVKHLDGTVIRVLITGKEPKVSRVAEHLEGEAKRISEWESDD